MRCFLFLILLFFSQLQAMSDVDKLICEASAHNTYFLYEDAIKLLDEAIKLNPHDKEAYKERAFSHFELGCIDSALEDYNQAIDFKPPYKRHKRNKKNFSLSLQPLALNSSSSSLDFPKGLIYGAMLGGREGSIQFVSSIRGGLTFLWSFACSPIDVSKELIEALYVFHMLHKYNF